MLDKIEYNYKDKINIDLALNKDVFRPTGTTDVLIDAVVNNIKKSGKLLDLGCGSGVVGMVLYKMGKICSQAHHRPRPDRHCAVKSTTQGISH